MAIKAREAITMSWVVDITSVTWYYKLQASTAAKPAKPTTATPSGWTTTEATYTEGSTNSLYIVQKTTYSDGTFEYSDVSLSSSYEASKTAYNKAVAASNAADALQPELIAGTHGTTATATWTGTSTRLTEIVSGTIIQFKLSSAGASNVTLNLTLADGSKTGAKNVFYSNTTRLGTQYPVNSIVQLIYNGTAWYVTNPYTNNNTIASYGGIFDAGPNGIKNYSLIMRDGEKTWSSLTTAAGTAATKARNTAGFYYDKIYYMASNSAYASGTKCGTCYLTYAFDLRYSTNCEKTLTYGVPVYLVGTVDPDDGLFYLNPTWWTQTEPTEEDGYTYIYLGIAYSAYQVYLAATHPARRFYAGEFLTEEEIQTRQAQATADDKNAVFYQGSAPSADGRKMYDVWFDTSNDNQMYFWNGSAWSPKQFGTDAIANSAITADLLAANSVTADKIVAATITGAKIASATITAGNIASNAVTAAKIASNAVTAAKIKAGSVTTDKLAANAVTAEKIDVNDLFAQTITATGSISGATIHAANGSTIGDTDSVYIEISSGAMDLYNSNERIMHIGYSTHAVGADDYISAPYFSIGARKINTELGGFSVTEGYDSVASGYASHAEGVSCIAQSESSHAEGYHTSVYRIPEEFTEYGSDIFSGYKASHAEGMFTSAYGSASHAEGYYSIAENNGSHAEGYNTRARGNYSHAGGYNTVASEMAQTVIGKYNVVSVDYGEIGETVGNEDELTAVDGHATYDAGDYAFVVGNGTGSTARSNALTLDWNGNLDVKGDVTINNGASLAACDDKLKLTSAACTQIANGTVAPNVAWKVANLVVVMYSVAGANIAGNNGTICTLPVGYRPSSNRLIMGYGNYNGAFSPIYAVVFTDGTIKTAHGNYTVTSINFRCAVFPL